MTELLPCPFCGSDKLTMHRGMHLYDDHEIMCHKCCASGGNFDEHQYEEWEKNKHEAIEHWNTRPIEAALQSQIERLTKERDEAREKAQSYRDCYYAIIPDRRNTGKLPWEDRTDE